MPTASARAAQQAARYLLEHYSHTRPTWQVNPDAALSNVVVFGCRQPPAGEHLLDHQAHAFTLAAGTPLPPVWAALCGRPRYGPTVPGVRAALGRRPRINQPCRVARQVRAQTWRGS